MTWASAQDISIFPAYVPAAYLCPKNLKTSEFQSPRCDTFIKPTDHISNPKIVRHADEISFFLALR